MNFAPTPRLTPCLFAAVSEYLHLCPFDRSRSRLNLFFRSDRGLLEALRSENPPEYEISPPLAPPDGYGSSLCPRFFLLGVVGAPLEPWERMAFACPPSRLDAERDLSPLYWTVVLITWYYLTRGLLDPFRSS